MKTTENTTKKNKERYVVGVDIGDPKGDKTAITTIDGEQYILAHIDVDSFSHKLIEAYYNALYSEIEEEHGIKKDFFTYSDEILDAIARTLSTILICIEDCSFIKDDKLNDKLIDLLIKYWSFK